MLQTPRQLRPWRGAPRSSPALSARASHDRIQASRHRAEAKKSGSISGSAADNDATANPSPALTIVARDAVAKLAALGAALALSPPLALAFSGIPEPSAPPAVVTSSKNTTTANEKTSVAPPSDGTLQIKFLASPDPEVRLAQTALVEAWGKVSTMYFDHEFGGADWRGALQEALDDSFRSASGGSATSSSSVAPSSSSASSSASSASPTSSSSSSEEEDEKRRKKAIAGTYDAIDTMLSKLGDPYTRVLRPADAGSYVAGAEGEGLSLGLQLQASSFSSSSSSSTSSSSTSPPLPPVVAAVVPDSPAARAGIAPGDSLLAIDGQATRGRPIEDLALSLTREADVTFLPRGGGGGGGGKGRAATTRAAKSLKELLPRTVHLKPASVSLHAVQWARLKTRGGGGAEGEGAAAAAAPKVAYVRVAAFNRLAPSDVARALDSLFGGGKGSGRGGASPPPPPPVLLLDLRDNSGGAVDAGVDVAALLLPRNDQRETNKTAAAAPAPPAPPVFFFGSVRDGAGNEERVEVDASRGKLPAGTRLGVLVNGGTASTSELVAAALRGEQGGKGEQGTLSSSSSSSSSALLVGERTFKKARTQRAVPLTGGGLLLVSNLQYISPRGEGVDGVGLAPEVSCRPGEVERTFFVSGGSGGEDDEFSGGGDELLAEDLLFDPCVRVAAEALGAPLAEPTAVE